MLDTNNLIKSISIYKPNFNRGLIEHAYSYAAEAHKNIKRLSGDPYISHPLNVAYILAELKVDEKTIAAALLHDVIEDCHISIDQLKKEFGEDISFLVNGVTRISSIRFQDKDIYNIENIKKMLMASAQDIRVILIKLADRLHNMRTLEFLPPSKQQQISKFTLEIYAPIAYRLGLGEIKAELEDLAFKYLNPVEFKSISKRLELTLHDMQEIISEAKMLIEQKLSQNHLSFRVDGRTKHIYSIYRKVHIRKVPFEKIYDIIALRIILTNERDCYTALGLIHHLWTPLPGYLKDYIAMPKENMYRSIHTVVIGPKGKPIELQIRTEEMHIINEEGIAAHYRYKGFHEDEGFQKKMKWLKEILEWQQNLGYQDFIKNLKFDLFDYEIFVFTPKGDIIKLPKGATPIDFAYSIHSQIGDLCHGAFVNDKFVPLNYELSNGDVVKIVTNKKHKPSKDWLRFAKTNKARAKIIQAIKSSGIPYKNISFESTSNLSLIKTSSNLNSKFKFSPCCSPLPLDNIKGFENKKGVITVHSHDCKVPISVNLKKIPISWNINQNRSIPITVIATDRVGLLGELMNIFYEFNINVKKVKAKLLDTQLAECRFEINLQNPQSISAILSKIKNLKDIKRIYISSINYK